MVDLLFTVENQLEVVGKKTKTEQSLINEIALKPVLQTVHYGWNTSHVDF